MRTYITLSTLHGLKSRDPVEVQGPRLHIQGSVSCTCEETKGTICHLN